ncbi:MAG: dual specificity protein phosphatase family protein [Euryarchaeota archaeon]|nr:dual specificity protein phosphatase family protein [Euryarchaeota archaeon]
MIERIDGNVAVGNWRDARDIDMLRDEGIDMIIDARILFDDSNGHKLRTPHIDLIQREVGFMLVMAGMGAKMLVRCYHGRDRSPFVAMIYLARRNGTSYYEAYRAVKEKRPMTIFHWDWVKLFETRSPSPGNSINDDIGPPD